MAKDVKIYPVEGYETVYGITSDGRVYSFYHNRWGRRKAPILLKATPASNGYPRVTLRKDGKIKYVNVHRLVAEAFLPNPKQFPVINHISGDKTDNRAENLEWCTQAHNIKHGWAMQLGKI